MRLLEKVFALIIFYTCVGNMNTTLSQVRAFPGAEGFGAYSKGGRGGDVYTVSNLNDGGPGSLREGIRSATGPRTIVFSVSGLIQLKSGLSIDKDFITIAGQSAPGDGICLRDAPLSIKANHIIIRYIRVRLGDEAGREDDAISIGKGHHIILDHCSASWSVDECLSCSTGQRDLIDSITVQWCIISEALQNSIHSKGAHSYGALIRGCYGARYTYHHNLFAHNSSRNPRPGNYDNNKVLLDPDGLLLDFRNNVLYNWRGSRPGYDADSESRCRYNYIGNYGKPGPDSDKTGHAYGAKCRYFQAYYNGNHFFGGVPDDQYSLVDFGSGWTEYEKDRYKMKEAFPAGPIQTETAENAFHHVMEHAGASLQRDPVDLRVIKDVIEGTGAIIDDEDEVGGWPEYNTYDIQSDSDHDGMPDQWEQSRGLDPGDPKDCNWDRDLDGYTNLEEYLNSLITVYPDLSPSVSILSPEYGLGILQTDTIPLQICATDYGGGWIEQLELFVNGDIILEADTAYIDTILVGMPPGSHLLLAKATDNHGNETRDSTKIFMGSKYTSLTLETGLGEGTVSLDPPGGYYMENTEITLQAIPAFSYSFSGWTGSHIGTVNPLNLSMKQDLSLAANFLRDSTSEVRINFQPESSSLSSGYIPDFGKQYGERQKGYYFGWRGGTQRAASVRNDQADPRLATFIPMQYPDQSTWEFGIPEGIYAVYIHFEDPGTSEQVKSLTIEGIELTDENGTGFYGEYLIDSIPVSDGKLSIEPKGNSVKIHYLKIGLPSKIFGKYLNVEHGKGDGEYQIGEWVEITTDPPPLGYLFDRWTGDVEGVNNIFESTAILTMPGEDISVKANYIEETYTLTVFNGTGGGNYKPGKTVYITADAPPDRQVFSKWIADAGLNVDFSNESASFTWFTMPDHDLLIRAEFLEVVSIPTIEKGKARSIHSYPNPSDGVFFINLDGLGTCNIHIYDMLGRKRYSKLAHGGLLRIEDSRLSSGVYLLKVCDQFGELPMHQLVIIN